MPKIPRISGKELIKFLESQGYSLARVKGSHHLMKKESVLVVVPVHGKSPLKLGTLQKILRSIDLTNNEFSKFLKNSKN